MNIALLGRGSNNKKEATNITLISLKNELNKSEYTEIIYGKGILEHVSKFKDKQKEIEHKFDIIHGFSAAPLLALKVILAKRYSKNAKTIQTLKSYSKRFFGGLFFSRILNFVDFVTVPTKVMANKLIKHGVKPDKIKIIRSHIDINKFVPMNQEKLKEKYGYQDKKIIIYYGSLFKSKGVETLIESSDLLNKDNGEYLVLIAPRHGVPEEFKDLITNKNIKIITEDIDVVEYVNLADVVVLPYKDMIATEGNPSCMLEAMACKTPVVTTDLPELKEIVEKDNDVLMVKPGDVESLANEINKLLKDEKLQKKLVENAYKKSKQFDGRLITKQFIDLYKKLKKAQ